MRFSASLYSFLRSESGAVTVDWVVLTAALVGLGMAATNMVGGGLRDVTDRIHDQLLQDHITHAFD